MRELQKLLEEQFKKLPQHILTAEFKRKLKSKRIKGPPDLASKLAEHFLSGKRTPLVMDDGKGGKRKNITISFSPEEEKALITKIDDIVHRRIPEMVGPLAESSAKIIFEGLEKSWPEQEDWELAVQDGFRITVDSTWGEGLSRLRRLLTSCREIGEERAKRWRRPRKSPNYRRGLLVRLHARSCQVTAEILCLSENGFADAALARWRTLHEINVVMTLVAENGDELAERYFDHEAVEAKQALDVYEKSYRALGYAPPSKRHARHTEKVYLQMMQKHGPNFGSQYGWAADLLKIKKPTFVQLEDAAKAALMRAHYKMASHGVHAGARGIFGTLGSMDDINLILAAGSDAGLGEPGRNAAITLALTTLHMFERPYNFDDLVTMHLLSKLSTSVAPALAKAERRQARKVSAFRRENKARANA